MPLDDKTAIDAEHTHDAAPVSHSLEVPTTPLGTTPVEGQFANEGVTELTGKPRTLWGDAWRRLRKNKLALVSLAYLSIMAFLAITVPLWATPLFGESLYIDTTTVVQNRFQPPSLSHPMGTDDLGRDEFARVIYGARVSLTVGLIATFISVVIGLALGGISGYYGGFTDSVVMRLTDVFLAFPYILFAILLISVMGPGFVSLLVAIGILGWTTIARVFRSSILSVKENEYVDAARATGASDIRILTRHIMPNSMAPIIVYATMSLGGVILSEAALSFLGVGVQPPTPSWGRMLNESQNFVVTHPTLFIWPGIAIVMTVLAFVLLGDGLRDALDVKMKD